MLQDPRDPEAVAAALEALGSQDCNALLVAYDRSRESERPDPFFLDPWARLLAGEKGRSQSAGMAAHPFRCNLDADGQPGAIQYAGQRAGGMIVPTGWPALL